MVDYFLVLVVYFTLVFPFTLVLASKTDCIPQVKVIKCKLFNHYYLLISHLAIYVFDKSCMVDVLFVFILIILITLEFSIYK